MAEVSDLGFAVKTASRAALKMHICILYDCAADFKTKFGHPQEFLNAEVAEDAKKCEILGIIF